MKILECVPNISEGRDQQLIRHIGRVIASVPQIKLLDISSDTDHNRSVYTFIGPPSAVQEAAFQSAKATAELLDITQHTGVHPRSGVMDVIPFIPVIDACFEDCIPVAESLGKRICDYLKIPVHYYGFHPQTQKLKNSKTHRFTDSQTQELKNSHDSLPDLRQHTRQNSHDQHTSAGTIAIGVRDFMIAYNVNLATADLAKAKAIAGKIREKNGGLPGVRALGFELKSRGIVQVSMNLIDPQTTLPQAVYEAVKKEAHQLGVEVIEEEIVGLLPETVISAAKKIQS